MVDLPGARAAHYLAVRQARPGDRSVLTTDGVHAVLEPRHLAPDNSGVVEVDV